MRAEAQPKLQNLRWPSGCRRFKWQRGIACDRRSLFQVPLVKAHRNEIFRAVEGAGFSPKEFGFESATGTDESICRHLQSGARFVVRGRRRRLQHVVVGRA